MSLDHDQQSDDLDTEAHPEESREPARKPAKKEITRVVLVPYPKIIYMYPTFLAALACAVFLTIRGEPPEAGIPRYVVTATWVFLAVFGLNLIVLTLDFARGSALLLLFAVVSVVLGVVLWSTWNPELIPMARDVFKELHPVADSTFFWVVTGIFALVFLVAKIHVQFDYWEFRRNELLHHHGLLSDLRQYPTAGVNIEKEITDVFEYLLAGSGRLVIRVPGQPRAFVLDNVPFISRKEKKIIELRSAIKVKAYERGDH